MKTMKAGLILGLALKTGYGAESTSDTSQREFRNNCNNYVEFGTLLKGTETLRKVEYSKKNTHPELITHIEQMTDAIF